MVCEGTTGVCERIYHYQFQIATVPSGEDRGETDVFAG